MHCWWTWARARTTAVAGFACFFFLRRASSLIHYIVVSSTSFLNSIDKYHVRSVLECLPVRAMEGRIRFIQTKLVHLISFQNYPKKSYEVRSISFHKLIRRHSSNGIQFDADDANKHPNRLSQTSFNQILNFFYLVKRLNAQGIW